MIFATTTDGLRGLLPYRSMYRLRAHGDPTGAAAAQRVYRFKARGESAEIWRALIDSAAADLDCAAVWAVPGHDPAKPGELPALLGETIRRTAFTAPRKYAHGAPVDLSTLAFPPAPDNGGAVLLVDDVSTTGATLRGIRAHLAGLGVKAVPLALGLNWKLIPPGFDADALSVQWETFGAAVAGNAPDRNEQRRERRKAACLIERPTVADPDRRARLERDPAAWLRWYLAAAFPLPFGAVHKDMIRAAVRAIKTGAGMACAAPRGTGKTTVLSGVALWAVLSGACRFPVVAGWSHTAARRMLRKWLDALSDNERLAADYPTACAPFRHSQHANRLRGLAWADTQEPIGADVQQMTGTICLPDSAGALGAISISGNTRGLSVGLPDGSALRPDVLLLDDPQNKPTAEGPNLTRKVIEKIETDLFNLSGPDARLAVMAAVTIIAEADVATHFLEHADFEAVRVGQVTQWPTGWEDGKSAVRALWDEWNAVRLAGLRDHDGGLAARKYYRTHKGELTAGMAVSWPARFDRKRKDPDALFAAMLDFYRLGERAFMAERQNAPLKSAEASIFELPQSLVAKKTNGLARRVAPDGAAYLVGMADINADAARWALAAASNTAALSILDYGAYPGGRDLLMPPGQSEAVALMRGLSGLDELLRSLSIMRGPDRMPVDIMLLDVGYSMAACFDWLNGPARTSPIPWMASRGWGARMYRPSRSTVGLPGEEWHAAQWAGKGRVISHNADYWRHRQQKAWLLPVGAPDSISFFGEPADRHELFADGVVCERLVAYAETNAGTLYKWNMTPGMRNDWGDVATGLFVAASRLGVTATGPRAVVRTRKKYSQRDFERNRPR